MFSVIIYRYMVGERAELFSALLSPQPEINEDLQAAELKYTVLNVF